MKRSLFSGLVVIVPLTLMSLVPLSKVLATGDEDPVIIEIMNEEICHEFCADTYPNDKQYYKTCYEGCMDWVEE